MSNKTVDFTLRHALEYANSSGSKDEEQVLVLSAPNLGSTKTKKNARKLKNLTMSAFGDQRRAMTPEQLKAEDLKEAKEDKEDAKEDKGDTKEIRDLLVSMSVQGVDTELLCEAMASLAPAVITIGETDIALKAIHWNALDMLDQEELTSVYITSFLV